MGEEVGGNEKRMGRKEEEREEREERDM